MNTYTVIVYVVPAGGHHVGTVVAANATDAVTRLREQLLLETHQCELVGVIAGRVHFELVDCAQVALAPYCAAIPE
jgi:hypothetical protein